MTLDPSLEDQAILADTRARAQALPARERVAECVVGVVLLASIGVLWLLRAPHLVDLPRAGLCIVVMALAIRVRFDTPFGFTVATQLVLIPLLFAVPSALVPVAVLVAFALEWLPDGIRGRRRAQLWQLPGHALFSVFPALVFAIAGTPAAHAGPALLILALIAQFAGDFVSSALFLRVSRAASVRSQLRETWVYAVDAALSGVGLVVARQMEHSLWAIVALIPLLWLLATFGRERRGRLDKLLELNETYRGTALLLGDVISADDAYTGGHSQGVVRLAVEVGRRLGLDAVQQRDLEFGALLHDVGKIAVPKRIINKPGRLTAAEWAIVKEHPAEGQRMLTRVGGFMLEVGLIVRDHHERWDGAGYPDGLRGPAIPLAARIITACDAWNAMRTNRSYRPALSVDAAVAEMQRNTGTQFDPAIVPVLLGLIAERRAPDTAEPLPAATPSLPGVAAPH